MLLNIFKSKNPIVLSFILLISMSFWIKGFLSPFQNLENSSPMPLYQLAMTILNNMRLQYFFGLILFILQMLYLLVISNNFKIFNENFFLHLFIFTLLVHSQTALHQLYPVYFSNLLLMMGVFRIFKSTNSDNAIHDYFEAAFLISFASLFYFNMLFFLLVVWIGLLVIRPLIWREWVASVIGAFIPYLFVSSYYFIVVDTQYFWLFELLKHIKFGFTPLKLDLVFVFTFGFSVFFIFIQSVKNKNLTISTRKIKVLLQWILFIALLVFLFIDRNIIQFVFIFAFVASFILPNFLVDIKRKWIANLLLFALIVVSIYQQFFS